MIEKVTEEQLRDLLARYSEQPKFDWKRDLTMPNDYKKSEFVKDVVAIANAHGDSTGYLVYGVAPEEARVCRRRRDETRDQSQSDAGTDDFDAHGDPQLSTCTRFTARLAMRGWLILGQPRHPRTAS